jgi:hypothetical protein
VFEKKKKTMTTFITFFDSFPKKKATTIVIAFFDGFVVKKVTRTMWSPTSMVAMLCKRRWQQAAVAFFLFFFFFFFSPFGLVH